MKIFEDKIYLDEDSFAFEIERKYKKKKLLTSSIPDNPDLFFGNNKIWQGAYGLISLIAQQYLSSYNIFAGISLSMILSKIVLLFKN